MLEQYSAPVRIYYEDTDAGGVVYHANYLKFMERLRTDWLREAGYDLRRLADELDIIFAVKSANLEYHAPARLNDLLSVSLALITLGKASLVIDHQLLRDQVRVCSGRIKLASLSASKLTIKPMPRALIDELSRWKTL